MRIRTIKPEFWTSESVSRVSIGARLLFVGLWTCCDDSGRARASSRLLASLLFPYGDASEKQISAWLDELREEGMVRLYEVNGDHYLDIPKWLEHQRIDRPSRSRIPEFVEPSRALVEPSRSLDVGREGKGREGKGIENRPPPPNKETHPELFRWLKGCDKFLADKKFMASISELMTNISTSHPDMDFWSLPQKAHSWLVANPHKPRKHLLAFFRNWVNKQAEGWPNKNASPLSDSDAGVGIQPLPD